MASLALLAGLAGINATSALAAATWTVTNNGDAVGATCTANAGAVGTTCTLRQAITQAASGDTITFAPGLTSPIALTQAPPLAITQSALTITGPGPAALQINGAGGEIFEDLGGTALTISGLAINGGLAGGSLNNLGGALYYGGSGTLSLSNDVFSNDSATGLAASGSVAYGGAVYISSSASVSASVANSTFSSDGATGAEGNDAGGAIYFAGASGTSTLSVTGSTFNGDNASGASTNVLDNSHGGAIEIGNGTGAASATISNSTFEGNTTSAVAPATSGGGAIDVNSPKTLTLVDDTLDGNTTSEAGAGGALSGSSNVTADGTIIADNTANGAANNCDGAVNAASQYDLEDSTASNSCGFNGDAHPVTAGNPLLAALANNGGPTQTQAIPTNSPAYGAVPAATCKAVPFLTVDQRGTPRPDSAAGETNCDIGAYEYSLPSSSGSGSTTTQVTPPATSTKVTASTPTVTVGQRVTYTATVSPSPGAGTVSFTDNGALVPGCVGLTVSSTGTATCTETYASVANHTIVASYSGTTSHAASSGALIEVVNPAIITRTTTSTHPSSAAGKARIKRVRTHGNSRSNTFTVTFSVSCSAGHGAPCRIHAALFTVRGHHRLALRTVTIFRGRTRSITIHLGRGVRRRVDAAHRLRVKLTVRRRGRRIKSAPLTLKS